MSYPICSVKFGLNLTCIFGRPQPQRRQRTRTHRLISLLDSHTAAAKHGSCTSIHVARIARKKRTATVPTRCTHSIPYTTRYGRTTRSRFAAAPRRGHASRPPHLRGRPIFAVTLRGRSSSRSPHLRGHASRSRFAVTLRGPAARRRASTGRLTGGAERGQSPPVFL